MSALLLVGEDESAQGIRTNRSENEFARLTATPTYTDETEEGMAGKIFDAGIIYQSGQGAAHGRRQILARPNYIPRPTGKELVVSEDLYNRLVREHKDLPEDIIEKLASDARRNDHIVQEYVQNRGRYGKTIIFADRWFQCVYLKTKLLEKGIRADAVYCPHRRRSRFGRGSQQADGERQRTHPR